MTSPKARPKKLRFPRRFLPGGALERRWRSQQAQTRARLDWLTDSWVIDGRPAPEFIPARLAREIRTAREAVLRTGGLERREQRAAAEIQRLQAAVRRLKIPRRGRPAGPSLNSDRSQFLSSVAAAIRRLRATHLRVTMTAVASELGRVERTLRRDLHAFGFSTWTALRQAAGD